MFVCVCARAHVRVDKNICIHTEKRLERYHAIVTNAHNLEERYMDIKLIYFYIIWTFNNENVTLL